MAFGSSRLIAVIIVSLLIGSGGCYVFISNSYLNQIQVNEDIIDSLNRELEIKIQSIGNLSQTINEQENMIEILSENLTNVNNEYSDIISSIQNEPNIIEEKEREIEDLEDELEDKNFEIIELNSRLGERLRWKTYNKHDVTFEYPEYMELSNIDLGYSAGQVLYRSYLDPVSYFTFIWMDTATLIEETADEITSDVEDTFFEKMIIVESEVYGHQAYIIHYTVQVGDGEYHGIMCIWECEDTGRTMALLHYSSEDPLSMFFECLGTIKCHGEGVVA